MNSRCISKYGQMKLNCLVVDDEPLARKGLMEYVAEVEFLQLAGACADTDAANRLLQEGNIHLVLLDIQMPQRTGIEWLKSLANPPLVIFTTAHAEYALEGYELDVVDFLLKPIPFDRFRKAVERAREFSEIRMKAGGQDEFIFVKTKGRLEKIQIGDIRFVEGLQNYVIIHLQNQKHIVYQTLTGMEKLLPAAQFMRVHKSYIVSLPHVQRIENHELHFANSIVPVSRSLREEVMTRVTGGKILKR